LLMTTGITTSSAGHNQLAARLLAPLLHHLERPQQGPFVVSGLQGGGTAWLVAAMAQLERPLLCITSTEDTAQALLQDLQLFTGHALLHYPALEIPPYTPLEPDKATLAQRITSLYHALTSPGPFIMVASAEALMRFTLPRRLLADSVELLAAGEEHDPQVIVRRLNEFGYEQVSLVQNPGEFAVRGGIVDVFPAGEDLPIRLDFFGDTLESIRSFDPISQRSVSQRQEQVLLPATDILFPPSDDDKKTLAQKISARGEKEHWDQGALNEIAERVSAGLDLNGAHFLLPLFYEAASAPFEFLPENTAAVLIEPDQINQSMDLLWERITANHALALERNTPALPPEELFLPPGDLFSGLERYHRVHLQLLATVGDGQDRRLEIRCLNHALVKQEIALKRRAQGLVSPLAQEIRNWMTQGGMVHLACSSPHHARHFAQMLENHGVQGNIVEGHLSSLPDSPGLHLHAHPLSQGFSLPEIGIHWLSEQELFGDTRIGRSRKARVPHAMETRRHDKLTPGDFVVHDVHGIGIYQGLITMEIDGLSCDFLEILYRDDDKLFVPVDQVNRISKYKGLNDKPPTVNKLGSAQWRTTCEKVQKAVWQVAQDLLKLYAKRKLVKGHAFSPPGSLFWEVAESFPFDETPGQAKAIDEVLSDLSAPYPMDRLVCGDVGFGKTEVAVRAAFKVVEDGYQVAVLVPTTVLAEQHAATFRERLDGFGVQVESISRFRSQAETRQIIKGISQGTVDILIGTHRLLSDDIRFKRLGLLIIDEEHRFGVAHKEKLKKIRSSVDVLTLTATPIPRTLQLSLLGVRDLSVINTPPAERRAIKTFIARQEDLVIREAVFREIARGGRFSSSTTGCVLSMRWRARWSGWYHRQKWPLPTARCR